MKIKQSLKKRLLGQIRTTILAIAALVMGQQVVLAQAPTEADCDAGLAYFIVQGEGSGFKPLLYSMPLGGTTAILVKDLSAVDPNIGTPNGLGFNSADNFLYAINEGGTVYRIGANGGMTALTINATPVNLLTSATFTAGDVANGKYYIYGGGKLVEIDLTTLTAAEVTLTAVGGTLTGNIDDFAYNPGDQKIYGVTSTRELFAIDPGAGTIIRKGVVGGTLASAPNNAKGTAFLDGSGNLYVGQNSNSTLYRVPNVVNGSSWVSTTFSDALGILPATPNDGARCPKDVPPVANPDYESISGSMDPINIPAIAGPGTGKDNPGTWNINNNSIILTIPSDPSVHNLTNPTVTSDGKTLTADEGEFKVNSNGTVTFTPHKNFNKEIVVNYTIKDSEGNVSNVTTITINADGTLPVDFGAVSATLQNGQLVVNWTTLTETGNSYFEVEASKDGKNFTKISDKVYSKADGGDSKVAIDYDFSIDLQNGNTLLGIALFSIAFIALLFNRKNKWLYTIVLVGGLSIFGASSCSKNDAGGIDASGKLFVRIKQVDKDGAVKYSNPVEVVKK